MRYIVSVWILYICFPQLTQGAGCNAYTGAVIREYDSTNVIGSSLSSYGDSTSETGMEMVFTHNDYKTSCTCGVVTMWQFYAWKPGTVVFYVLDGTAVKGTFSVTIGEQSDENFFEVPMSSDMWIPIRSGNRLGFYTSDKPMMRYDTVTGYTAGYYNTGRSLTTTVSGSGISTTDRKYGVAAYITEAHSPVFVNAPYTTTIYTHDTGNVIYTAIVLDVDGLDTLSVTKVSGNGTFTWSTSSLELTYSTPVDQGTYTVTLTVSDGCTTDTTETITINVINEGPTFLNLPASTTVLETDSSTVLHTITYSDPSDSVTCYIHSTNPTTSNFDISGDDITAVTPNYDFSSQNYYDIRIRCTDGTNNVFSNFQVDVIKNEPPIYNPGAGYLPGSVSVDTSSSVTIYLLNFTDPEGEAVTVETYALVGGGSNPFSVSSSGVVSTTSTLDAEGYDLEITIKDTSGALTGPYILSILTSGRPNTFNAVPVFVNLPYTKHVMEHTPVGTVLFKVLYTDENPTDTFTLTKTSSNAADTYLGFDAATGIINVTADIDFETVTSLTMDIEIDDGTDATTETITFTIVNVNENVTLTIATASLSADETLVRGTLVGDPGLTESDIDAVDTWYYTMDCGNDSKYFYLDTSDKQIYFAREYDMDAGLPGNATCNITVRDEGGLYDTGLVYLTINNINDHKPKFPKNVYVFFVSTTTTFFTEIVNMSATDDDSDIHGSTNGLLSYQFIPVDPTEEMFQIEASGVLFARNLTTYTGNYYIFTVVAEDDEGMTGSCTVTIIFSEAPKTTTTTTERAFVFTDDYKNYFWLLLLGIVVFVAIVVIGFMIWIDPKVNAYISFQMIRLNGWCRKKPKRNEPKRTVGKLRVTINNKHLENDPDNALPWELLAKDADVPEINVVQEMIEQRKDRKDRDYKNFVGVPVFEKGKGERPESSRATEYSTSGSIGRPDSESPKYATFLPNEDGDKQKSDEGGDDTDDGGEDQWGDLSDRQRVVRTPVVSFNDNEDW